MRSRNPVTGQLTTQPLQIGVRILLVLDILLFGRLRHLVFFC